MSIEDRVRKMLRLAQDAGAAEGEINNALDMVNKLIAQHNLDLAELLRQEEPSITGIGERTAWATTKWNSWMRRLVAVAMEVCECRAYYGYEPSKRTQVDAYHPRETVVFVGYLEDVEAACDLFCGLLYGIRAMARLRCGPGWGPDHLSYAEGYTERLLHRARDLGRQRKQEADEAGTQALVVSKIANIKKYEEEKLNLVSCRTRVSTGSSGRMSGAGWRDGEHADLSVDRSKRRKLE